MSALNNIKNELAKIIGCEPADFMLPPNEKLGDLSLPCFELAKKENINPVALAMEIAKKINSQKYQASVAGGYVNIIVNNNILAQEVLTEIKKNKNEFGRNQNGKNKKIMIEYSNGNTHKEYHVGHLRNICLGDAINKIISANGHKSVPVSYINDFGIHTAKTIWYFKNHQKELLKNNKNDQGYVLGQAYQLAVKELENNPEKKEEISLIMKSIESRKGEIYKLWQKTRKMSIDSFNKIYKELNVKFQNTFYESEVISDGLKLIPELLKKNILVKSEGAIIANLEQYNLAVLPIIRSDGTALYPVADLSLATKKFQKYKLLESIYVVDVRQSLYFKQIFKILELMGYKEKMTHLSYDFVTLPSGMMSSRSGNVITYQDLRSQAIEYCLKETKTKHPDWSEEKIKKTAEILAVSTIKFEMLKVSSQKTIVFDINEALRFDGYTATYLQYTSARIQSIIRKAKGIKKNKVDYSKLKDLAEHQLIVKLAFFPEIVERAGKTYDPSHIAKYLFELAQLFNDYYHNTSIIKSEAEIMSARIQLASNISQTIKNGLALLGIEAIEEI
jgi:arginyl-tRNA synthetase